MENYKCFKILIFIIDSNKKLDIHRFFYIIYYIILIKK